MATLPTNLIKGDLIGHLNMLETLTFDFELISLDGQKTQLQPLISIF